MNALEFKNNRKLLGYTQVDFAKELDIAGATVQHYESERSPIPSKIEVKVLELVNKYNATITQLQSGVAPLPSTEVTYSVPVLPIEALAGVGHTNDVQVILSQCEQISLRIKADALIPITGDSMLPNFVAGSFVPVRRVPMQYIQWGRAFVVDSITNRLMIKRIYPGTTTDTLTLRSDNGLKYPDFELPLTDIFSIWLVLEI